MDDFAGFTAPRCFDHASDIACPFRVLRVGPAMLLVEHVAQGVEGVLIAWWGDVEAFPARKLHARGDEMQFDAPFVCVPHPKYVTLIRLQPGEGQFLECVHRLNLLAAGGGVFSRERQHARAIGPFMGRGVDQRPGALGTAPKRLWQWFARQHDRCTMFVAQNVTILGIGDDLSGREITDWPRAAALAIFEELDQHGGCSCPELSREDFATTALNARSMATSSVATARASISWVSPRAVAMLSHRAI